MLVFFARQSFCVAPFDVEDPNFLGFNVQHVRDAVRGKVGLRLTSDDDILKWNEAIWSDRWHEVDVYVILCLLSWVKSFCRDDVLSLGEYKLFFDSRDNFHYFSEKISVGHHLFTNWSDDDSVLNRQLFFDALDLARNWRATPLEIVEGAAEFFFKEETISEKENRLVRLAIRRDQDKDRAAAQAQARAEAAQARVKYQVQGQPSSGEIVSLWGVTKPKEVEFTFSEGEKLQLSSRKKTKSTAPLGLCPAINDADSDLPEWLVKSRAGVRTKLVFEVNRPVPQVATMAGSW